MAAKRKKQQHINSSPNVDEDNSIDKLAAFREFLASKQYNGVLKAKDSDSDEEYQNSEYEHSSDEEFYDEDEDRRGRRIIPIKQKVTSRKKVTDSSYNDAFCSRYESDMDDDQEDNRPGPSQPSKLTRSGDNLGSAICPYPAPKLKGRERKRDVNNAVHGTAEAIKLVQLLRNRTSVNSASKQVVAPAEDEEISLQSIEILKSSMDMVNTSISMQNWVNDFQQQVVKAPEQFMLQHFEECNYDDLRSLFEKEILFWASASDESKASPSPYDYWKTSLKRYAQDHPLWKHHTEKYLDEMIKEAGIKVLGTINDLDNKIQNLIKTTAEWIQRMDEGLQNAFFLMKKFRILERDIESKNRNLDEFCHWGKKNLQEMFTAPYFKLSSQDYCNLVDQKDFMENVYGNALIDVKKQKWTNKDFKALQKFIKDVIVDAEYAKYVERYNYLISRIIFERTNRLQEDEELHRATQGRLTNRDTIVYDELGHGFGSRKGNPRVNRKKRVADCEHAKTTTQRCFKVPIAGSQSDEVIDVSAQITIKAQDLHKWFHVNEARLKKLTYDMLMKEDRYIQMIDWFKVAKKMTAETGKDRTANDCYLAWKHEAHTAVNSKRWTATELNKLMNTVQSHTDANGNVEWDEISADVGNDRTAYQCFYKCRNKLVLTEVLTWDDEKTKKIVNVIKNEGAKWDKAVEMTEDPRATKHQIQEKWKKMCNPMLRHGAFTRVEDALLLLSVEKLKAFIAKEQHFGILLSYLPWRFETVWRDRANNLFSNWIVPWTIEEDKMLLAFAQSQSGRKDWNTIAKQFSSFKNRKGCLTRYKILSKRIGTKPDQFCSVEEYHNKYAMTRYNVRQYQHLHEVLELLNRVIKEKKPSVPFGGLSNQTPPDEKELRYMLLDYDREVMQSTIKSIENYIQSRDAYWKPWTEQNGQLKKTFDRRTFNRADAQSVASAVHIRGIKLIPKDQVDGEPLTQFELDVYNYHARFCQTKSINENRDRDYLPIGKKLRKLPEITRIISLPSDDEESSASDWQSEPELPRKRGRPKKWLTGKKANQKNSAQQKNEEDETKSEEKKSKVRGTKRPRNGRSPKRVQPSSKKIRSELSVDNEPKKRGRPRKQLIQGSKNEMVSLNNELKKRERPSKQLIQGSKNEMVGLDNQPKKRGRSSKQLTQGSKNEMVGLNNQPKKRGRSSKQLTQGSKNEMVGLDNQPKKRGRSSKQLTQGSKNEMVGLDNQPKKRGRPPKQLTQGSKKETVKQKETQMKNSRDRPSNVKKVPPEPEKTAPLRRKSTRTRSCVAYEELDQVDLEILEDN